MKTNEKNDSWFSLVLAAGIGIFFGVEYIIDREGARDGELVDIFYLFMYFIFHTAVFSNAQCENNSKIFTQAALITSSVIAAIMLIPFICDMNGIYMYSCVSINGHENIHCEGIDYIQLGCIIFMVLCAIWGICVPLFELYLLKYNEDAKK